MRLRTQVAIIGAGPAGLLLSHVLEVLAACGLDERCGSKDDKSLFELALVRMKRLLARGCQLRSLLKFAMGLLAGSVLGAATVLVYECADGCAELNVLR